MYKLCKTAQSAQRQRELELGLLDAMKQCRYEEISISDLCAKMGVPRKTFYRYFDSKDGALYGLIDHMLLDYESFKADRLSGGKRTLEGELEQFFLFWKEKRGLLDAVMASGISGILIERVIRFALSEEVLPRRFLSEDSPEMQEHVTMFGVCGLLSMVLAWHAKNFSDSAEALACIAARLLSKPLFPSIDTYL